MASVGGGCDSRQRGWMAPPEEAKALVCGGVGCDAGGGGVR